MGERVTDEDWSRDDLTGRTAEDVEYARIDLAETLSDSGAVFENCVFRDCGFELAEHTGASFAGCVFTGCRFDNARWRECKFVGARFERCTFDRMSVHGGDWSFAHLPGADLRTATFDGVRMRETELARVAGTGMTLTGCDLSGAGLHGVTLERADLRGSDLTALDPWDAALRGARITWEQAIVVAHNLGLDVHPE